MRRHYAARDYITRLGTGKCDVILQAIMAIIMANVAGVDDLINYVVFVLWLQRFFVICALIWIRLKKIKVAESAVRVSSACTVATVPLCSPAYFRSP